MPHRQFLAAITTEKEPLYFHEVVKDAHCRQEMQDEINALERNNTWSMHPLPLVKKALGCKWVYHIKYNSDGTIERFKARLFVLGNHQEEGISYIDTFAHVVKVVTVRTILALVATKSWELHQMDVHNAFLHGYLHNEVFIRMPPGFSISASHMVCRLQKTLY